MESFDMQTLEKKVKISGERITTYEFLRNFDEATYTSSSESDVALNQEKSQQETKQERGRVLSLRLYFFRSRVVASWNQLTKDKG